jgi:hypothetical protein
VAAHGHMPQFVHQRLACESRRGCGTLVPCTAQHARAQPPRARSTRTAAMCPPSGTTVAVRCTCALTTASPLRPCACAAPQVIYLPGIPLPTSIVATPDIKTCVTGATMMVFVIPHNFLAPIVPKMSGAFAQGAIGISLIKVHNAHALTPTHPHTGSRTLAHSCTPALTFTLALALALSPQPHSHTLTRTSPLLPPSQPEPTALFTARPLTFSPHGPASDATRATHAVHVAVALPVPVVAHTTRCPCTALLLGCGAPSVRVCVTRRPSGASTRRPFAS